MCSNVGLTLMFGKRGTRTSKIGTAYTRTTEDDNSKGRSNENRDSRASSDNKTRRSRDGSNISYQA
ncbi:hypothetical protein RB213_004154 [Colletotrichum asianum]